MVSFGASPSSLRTRRYFVRAIVRTDGYRYANAVLSDMEDKAKIAVQTY